MEKLIFLKDGYSNHIIHRCIHNFVDDVLVSVRIPNRKLTVKAKVSDSILRLKERIEKETGISAYYQHLKLPGEQQQLDDDSKILRDSDQLTVHLETKLRGKDCNTA